MRISDWSSDVCSSDLLSSELHAAAAPAAARSDAGGRTRLMTPVRGARRRCAPLFLTLLALGGTPAPSVLAAPADRKSVVSGKSVSVRVDLGGRRSIKKKTQSRQHTTQL